jgi:hypothetical protein
MNTTNTLSRIVNSVEFLKAGLRRIGLTVFQLATAALVIFNVGYRLKIRRDAAADNIEFIEKKNWLKARALRYQQGLCSCDKMIVDWWNITGGPPFYCYHCGRPNI